MAEVRPLLEPLRLGLPARVTLVSATAAAAGRRPGRQDAARRRPEVDEVGLVASTRVRIVSLPVRNPFGLVA